ncbi:MAG: mannose-phosphate guanylyltransferase [Blastocatellia bacterium]|jgi:NDP-sugar pyrophosphorylase family protein|nr:mannose-phosphate guanylyltransferase [Blastocatellia bacterium]
MKAMILAAGFGERLWPLTCDRTKPALPVLGKPLVGYVAEYLAKYGIEDVIVNLHHQPDSVRQALGDGSDFGVRLEYVHEPVILGTSGALDNARRLLQDDTFVVVNGKLITDLDLRAALETHRQTKALATLVLLRNPKYERFSVVETLDGLVSNFGGMPPPAPVPDAEPPLMFTGIHILEPRIFDYIPPGVFSDSVTNVYLPAIAKGERIAAHVAEGMWYELSTLNRYLDISLALLRQRGMDLYSGRNPSIDKAADVQHAVLWDDVNIERGAHVRRAVLGDGVRIRSGERIEDAVVVRAELVSGMTPPPKALKGLVDGDNFVVQLSQ